MKKLIISTIIILTLTSPVLAEKTDFPGVGLDIFKEPYSKKVIITDIIPDSPAQKAGIKIGSELVSVNDKKTKNLSSCAIINQISPNTESTVKLVVKNSERKLNTYNLKTEELTIDEPNREPYFEIFWSQIAPRNLKDAVPIKPEIVKQFSRKYKKNILPAVTYWLNRKNQMMPGFKYCMTDSEDNQETCLVRLWINETQKTQADEMKYKFLQSDMLETAEDEITLSPTWIQKYRCKFEYSN
ncbi:PDZ domain-containing protein [bacterium]|nr:PDZ domain-containing protein [bacterium]